MKGSYIEFCWRGGKVAHCGPHKREGEVAESGWSGAGVGVENCEGETWEEGEGGKVKEE